MSSSVPFITKAMILLALQTLKHYVIVSNNNFCHDYYQAVVVWQTELAKTQEDADSDVVYEIFCLYLFIS